MRIIKIRMSLTLPQSRGLIVILKKKENDKTIALHIGKNDMYTRSTYIRKARNNINYYTNVFYNHRIVGLEM